MNNCTTDPIESTNPLPNLPLETREQILLYLDFNKLEEIRKFDKCVKQSKISTARVNNITKFGDMRVAIKNSKDNKYILENIKWIESKSMNDLNKSHECGNMMNHALMSNNVEIIQYFKNRNYPINSYIYILHKYYPIVDMFFKMEDIKKSTDELFVSGLMQKISSYILTANLDEHEEDHISLSDIPVHRLINKQGPNKQLIELFDIINYNFDKTVFRALSQCEFIDTIGNIKYLIQLGYQYDATIHNHDIDNKSVTFMTKMKENGIPIHNDVISCAIKQNSEFTYIKKIKQLSNWSTDTFQAALEYSKFDDKRRKMFENLFNMRCTPDVVFKSTAMEYLMKIIQFMYNNDYEYNGNTNMHRLMHRLINQYTESIQNLLVITLSYKQKYKYDLCDILIKQFQLKLTDDIFTRCIKYNDFSVLKYLKTHNCPVSEESLTEALSVTDISLDILELLLLEKQYFVRSPFVTAAKYNNIIVLDWLYKKCGLDSQTLAVSPVILENALLIRLQSIDTRKLPLIQPFINYDNIIWLKRHGIQFTERIFSICLLKYNLDISKFLVCGGCPIDPNVILTFVRNIDKLDWDILNPDSNFNKLRWLCTLGLKCTSEVYISLWEKCQTSMTFKACCDLIKGTGCPLESRLLLFAFKTNNQGFIDRLRENNCPEPISFVAD